MGVGGPPPKSSFIHFPYGNSVPGTDFSRSLSMSAVLADLKTPFEGKGVTAPLQQKEPCSS